MNALYRRRCSMRFVMVVMLFVISAGVGSAQSFNSLKEGYSYTPVLWQHIAGKDAMGMRYSTQINSGRPNNVSLITVMSGADVVAVRSYFIPVCAYGADDKDIISPRTSRTPSTSFSPVVKSGEVSLSGTELTANPYTIKKFRVKTDVIIATARETKVMRSDVGDFQTLDAAGQLKVQIKTLDYDIRTNILRVTVAYERTDRGTAVPFLDSVYAVDSSGKDIDGRRWDGSGGQPFSNAGTLMFIFSLEDVKQAEGKTYRLVAVTQNVMEPVEFDITDIFQK